MRSSSYAFFARNALKDGDGDVMSVCLSVRPSVR